MNNQDIKELCLKLIHADFEEEIISILKEYGYWDNDKYWRFYGDKENNWSQVNNQGDTSDIALVEKLTNSIDARLMNECLLNNIDPEGKNAPKSILEAVALFFEDNPKSSDAGLVSRWTDGKRREIAQGITLSATGHGPKSGDPSYTISDCGEGQTPKSIPNTLLSLTESNKLKIPFLHGKFNQGGSGVILFCGKKHLQLSFP